MDLVCNYGRRKNKRRWIGHQPCSGITTISAKSGTITGSALLTVTAAGLTSLSVTPATASVPLGINQQFSATGTYSDGSTQNLSSTVKWTSSATSVATISGSGLATTLAPGSTTIAASSGAITGSSTLKVKAAVLTSISVTPATASIPLGTNQQFAATGTYSNGSTQNLTNTVTWTSSRTHGNCERADWPRAALKELQPLRPRPAQSAARPR